MSSVSSNDAVRSLIGQVPEHDFRERFHARERISVVLMELLGGIEMKLGMPKAAILGALEGKYRFTSAGEDSWFIMEKGDPPSKVIGGIAFKEGKLSWISRDWSNFEKATALESAAMR